MRTRWSQYFTKQTQTKLNWTFLHVLHVNSLIILYELIKWLILMRTEKLNHHKHAATCLCLIITTLRFDGAPTEKNRRTQCAQLHEVRLCWPRLYSAPLGCTRTSNNVNYNTVTATLYNGGNVQMRDQKPTLRPLPVNPLLLNQVFSKAETAFQTHLKQSSGLGGFSLVLHSGPAVMKRVSRNPGSG